MTDDFLRGGGDDAVLVLLGGPRLRAAEEAGAQRDRLGAEVEGGCDLLSGRDAPAATTGSEVTASAVAGSRTDSVVVPRT